ncbi:hypothetical protein QA601_17670 [Chitinispirillales bacterium ANBcel5]|uniref:hypothetical protein n=1 Tax=Cellulosispirillum alkaliphilum TaxID=3039283 RepID=UPI002A537A46|nr:hypothetical protein [Chitinispirillales bacterium ANBcel5]
MSDSILNLAGSSTDSNKFYSILLDARAANVSDSMYDIAEKLLVGEKDNAKLALEQLWTLKKNVLNSNTAATVDMLIEYYQEKMDILRYKEENIKNISKDSRSLLEEKHKRDEEIASVKQQISDCTNEINELTSKLTDLRSREQELTLIEEQLKRELYGNENEVINGLYEIILSQADSQEPQITKQPLQVLKQPPVIDPSPQEKPIIENSEHRNKEDEHKSFETPEKQIEISEIPKSVVKTTKGVVIGEYYYDSKAEKQKRNYVLNSKFFSDKLNKTLKAITIKYDHTLYSEMLQMIQDAYKRVSQNPKIHVEISTNEILNLKTLKLLWQNVKIRSFDEASRFGAKLKAKIETLDTNYVTVLQEQLQRCSTEN